MLRLHGCSFVNNYASFNESKALEFACLPLHPLSLHALVLQKWSQACFPSWAGLQQAHALVTHTVLACAVKIPFFDAGINASAAAAIFVT